MVRVTVFRVLSFNTDTDTLGKVPLNGLNRPSQRTLAT